MTDNFPEIETERLRLREFRPDDADKIREIYTDWEVVKYYGLPFIHTLEEARQEIDWFINLYPKKEGIRWCITEKDKDLYIGDIGYYEWEKDDFRAEFGFKLERAHWRKGFISEIVPAVLSFGYNKMNLNRIQAIVDPRNEPSWKMLEKYRFKKEGLLRDFEYEHGGFVSVYMYALLKNEASGII